MCEIVRAAIAEGKMGSITPDLSHLPPSILDLIDCPGDEK